MKKKEKNIMLVSLGNANASNEHLYFCHEEGGVTRYCDGMIQAEAGAKYILSKEHIDEMIVIGSGATYDEEDVQRKMPLGEGIDFYMADPKQLSEYGLFRYRMAEYLESIDLEEYESLEEISEEDKAEAIEIYNRFHAEFGKNTGRRRTDMLFHRLQNDPESYEELCSRITEKKEELIPWMKRYIYSKMSDSFKFRALESNENLQISFIPTQKKNDGTVDIQNMIQIIHALLGSEDEIINLYIDTQGLDRSNDATMVVILSILNNEWNKRIRIRQILTTEYIPSRLAGIISNDIRQYEINNLLAGMNAFIQYGKVGMIRQFWEDRDIENPHVEKLIRAMGYIDDGISLCNLTDLEYGIQELRKVFADPNKSYGDDMDSSILAIMEEGISRDYGSLLEDDGTGEIDVLELIKWAYRKKFYQQTLTMIESRIPTDFVKRGVLFYASNAEEKDAMMKAFANEYWRTQPKDRYKFRDLNHFFIKFYGRFLMNYRQSSTKVLQDYAQLRVGQLDKPHPKLVKACSLVEDKAALEELLFSYYYIGDVRNKVSHGLSGEKKYPGQRMLEKENENVALLNKAIEYFIQQYDIVRKMIDGKEFTNLIITEAELDKYAYANRQNNFRHGHGKGRGRDNRKNQEGKDASGNQDTSENQDASGRSASPDNQKTDEKKEISEK